MDLAKNVLELAKVQHTPFAQKSLIQALIMQSSRALGFYLKELNYLGETLSRQVTELQKDFQQNPKASNFTVQELISLCNDSESWLSQLLDAEESLNYAKRDWGKGLRSGAPQPLAQNIIVSSNDTGEEAKKLHWMDCKVETVRDMMEKLEEMVARHQASDVEY